MNIAEGFDIKRRIIMGMMKDLAIELKEMCFDVLEDYMLVFMPKDVQCDTYYYDNEPLKISCRFVVNHPSKIAEISISRTVIIDFNLEDLPKEVYQKDEWAVKAFVLQEVRDLSELFCDELKKGTKLFSYVDSIYNFHSKVFSQDEIMKLLADGKLTDID